MTDAKVAVEPFKDDRFVLYLLDPISGEMRQGPHAGEDFDGYTADDLRAVLADICGLTAAEIEKRIEAAESQRTHSV